MRHVKSGLVLLLVAAILAACGGGGSNEPAKPKFTKQVSFGDSLSDVGSYKVGTVAALSGGQFTINSAISTNWTELTAAQFGLAAPCAALTGLDGNAGQGFSVMPPVLHAGCTSYAQGGARVTDPQGVGNKLNGGNDAIIGMLTTPIVTQIANYLADAPGNKFAGDEIVFVMAGANDAFFQAGLVSNLLTTPTAAGVAMYTAATELTTYIQTQILDKGARYVVVMNIPDISSTPQVTSIADPTAKAQNKLLFDGLISTYNTQLKAGLDAMEATKVLQVDAFTASQDEVANPAKYNLTDVTGTACNLAAPSNPLASSLVCNSGNLNAGVTATSHLFADKVHPTPYGHALFATYVLQEMVNKGWF